MSKVIQGETVHRITTVDADAQTVTKYHVTTHAVDGDHAVRWTFDYSKCSPEQILELASRDSVIKARPEFKKVPVSEIEAWTDKRFDVAAMLERQRTTQTPFQKVSGNVPLLSKADRAMLKEQLEALDYADSQAEEDETVAE